MVAFGLAKLGRFRMLKNSVRNWTIPCSPRNSALLSLLIAKSTFFKSGPRKKFRGSFPRVPARGRSNIVSLNQLLGLCVITVARLNDGSRFGRSFAVPAAAGLFESELLPMVKHDRNPSPKDWSDRQSIGRTNDNTDMPE